MHFTSITFVVSLLAAIESTVAAPSSRRTAARYEPLFKQANPSIAVDHSIGTLRSRRRAEAAAAEREVRLKMKSNSSPVTISATVGNLDSTNRLTKRGFSAASILVMDGTTLLHSKQFGPPSISNLTNIKRTIQPRTITMSNPKSIQPAVAFAPRNPRYWTSPTDATVQKRSLEMAAIEKRTIKERALEVILIELETPSFFNCDIWEVVSGTVTTTLVAPTATNSLGSIALPSMSITGSTATATSVSPGFAATTRTASSSSATPTWPAQNGLIASTYFPSWAPDISVDFSKFDLLDFAFALPDAEFNVAFDDATMSILNNLVTAAHAANTKVLVSIGGWTGSGFFSSAVASAANRAIFIGNIVELVTASKADGVDIDWEYPGTGGRNGNQVSPSDTANFLVFLQELKVALPAGQNRTSATGSHIAFIGADGSPIADVKAFAATLDNLLVMNYDVWGASSTPGPNSPLSDACPDSMQPNANQASAVATWTAAGMPASKLLMGVAAYGYISTSSATTLVHRRSAPSTKSARQVWYENGLKKAASARIIAKRDQRAVNKAAIAKRHAVIFCPGNHSGQPCAGVANQTISAIAWNPMVNATNITATASSGGVFVPGSSVVKAATGNGDLSTLLNNQIQFNALISNGVLSVVNNDNGTDTFNGINGYTKKLDPCSSTPFLINAARQVVVTYDDPRSMFLKGAAVLASGLGGINMWDVTGDFNYQLTDGWRSGMGLSN